ncbi:hypothetical protein CHS0354_040978 [Potamilus streckersoni]|uniref:Uncharacterized protein n=1 Tax=Potamilus streckersoni TaxID=2493646 RepID=A0AAE0T7X3_9BIVA|nr:hypothetical protein CHS0354_040978 [Potamilus streckersoni]
MIGSSAIHKRSACCSKGRLNTENKGSLTKRQKSNFILVVFVFCEFRKNQQITKCDDASDVFDPFSGSMGIEGSRPNSCYSGSLRAHIKKSPPIMIWEGKNKRGELKTITCRKNDGTTEGVNYADSRGVERPYRGTPFYKTFTTKNSNNISSAIESDYDSTGTRQWSKVKKNEKETE